MPLHVVVSCQSSVFSRISLKISLFRIPVLDLVGDPFLIGKTRSVVEVFRYVVENNLHVLWVTHVFPTTYVFDVVHNMSPTRYPKGVVHNIYPLFPTTYHMRSTIYKHRAKVISTRYCKQRLICCTGIHYGTCCGQRLICCGVCSLWVTICCGYHTYIVEICCGQRPLIVYVVGEDMLWVTLF